MLLPTAPCHPLCVPSWAHGLLGSGVGGGFLEMGGVHIHEEKEEIEQIPVRERITLRNLILTGRFSSPVQATNVKGSGSVVFKLGS